MKKNPSEQPILQSFLLESAAHNTAPPILFAALKVMETIGPDAILLILPADHLIQDITAFQQACATAILLANNDQLVTFGIKPTAAETGFGYIEIGAALPAHTNCYQVKRFVEKPSHELAETYFTSGKFLWNAGMFCFKASTILKQFEEHAPVLCAAAKNCWAVTRQNKPNTAVIELDVESFNQLENISIDYAIMEKSSAIATIACDFDWQDIGSWEAYRKLYSADADGNTILGDAVAIASHDNFIHSENRMVAAIGIDHLAIIDTPDAMLVTHRDRVQEVKDVVKILKEKAHESYMTHRTVIRPWGLYTVLEEGPSFKIKRIVVKPNAALSLQSHERRSEHWVVVSGIAKVQHDKKEYTLKINESTFVPMGTPHRLSNPGDEDLIIIEVQTGSYLGEDDIVRYEDTYGRTH